MSVALVFTGCEKEEVKEPVGTVIIWSSSGAIQLSSKELGVFWVYPSIGEPKEWAQNSFDENGNQTIYRFENLPPRTIHGTFVTDRGTEGDWQLTPVAGYTLIMRASAIRGWR